MSTTTRSLPLSKNYRLIFIAIIFTLLAVVLYSSSFDVGVDYIETFRPAVKLLLQGESPYTLIYNPPWVLLPFIPLSLLPTAIAYKTWLIVSFAIFALAL
jgi:hypothetical protein